MTGKYNRQTAAEDRRRADRLYERARDPDLPGGQKEKIFNEAAENEKHARTVTDEVESDKEEASQPDSTSDDQVVVTPV